MENRQCPGAVFRAACGLSDRIGTPGDGTAARLLLLSGISSTAGECARSSGGLSGGRDRVCRQCWVAAGAMRAVAAITRRSRRFEVFSLLEDMHGASLYVHVSSPIPRLGEPVCRSDTPPKRCAYEVACLPSAHAHPAACRSVICAKNPPRFASFASIRRRVSAAESGPLVGPLSHILPSLSKGG